MDIHLVTPSLPLLQIFTPSNEYSYTEVRGAKVAVRVSYMLCGSTPYSCSGMACGEEHELLIAWPHSQAK